MRKIFIFIFLNSLCDIYGEIIHLPPQGEYIEPNLQKVIMQENVARTLPTVASRTMRMALKDKKMAPVFKELFDKYKSAVFHPEIQSYGPIQKREMPLEITDFEGKSIIFFNYSDKKQLEDVTKFAAKSSTIIHFIVYGAVLTDNKIFSKQEEFKRHAVFIQFHGDALKQFQISSLPAIMYVDNSKKILLQSGSLDINHE